METAKLPTDFQCSTTLEEFMGRMRNNIFSAFDRFPFYDLRAQSMEYLEKNVNADSTHDWAEPRIAWMFRHDDPLAMRLLSWYVFTTANRGYARRALEFAISIPNPKTDSRRAELDKMINKRLTGRDDLYWGSTSVWKYLRRTLAMAQDPFNSANPYAYPEANWILTERAVRRIVQVRDISSFPEVAELARFHKRGMIYPADKAKEFDRNQHQVFLDTAVNILKKAERSQCPDYNAKLFSRFREFFKSLDVEIVHPTMCVPGETVEIRVKGTHWCYKDGNPVLAVRWRGEGFSSVVPPESRVQFDLGSGCIFRDVAPGGVSRFWLTFEWQKGDNLWEEVVTTVGYVKATLPRA